MFKFIVFASLLAVTTVYGQSRLQLKDIEKQILDQLLDKNKYDTRITPVGPEVNGTQGPVVINTNFFIRSIEYVCTKKQEFKTQLTFRHQWTDPRLKYDDRNGKVSYLNLDNPAYIWTPDTFFSNSRASEVLKDLKPNNLVRIYPNGTVLYSIRLVETLACPMDLKHYPFDTQTCPIKIASYGFTSTDLVYEWKAETPIQVTKQLSLSGFTLENFDTDYCTSSTLTGEYSCLRVNLQFRRESGLYGCQWFLPTAVLTFIAFISFWMKPTKTSRIKLLVVTLVLLYLHILYINQKSSATVSYHTAKDCWLSVCLLFVLSAFLELAIVRLIQRFVRHSAHKSAATDTSECKNGNTINNCEEGADAVALKPLVEDGDQEKQDKEETKDYNATEVANRRCNYTQKWGQLSLASRIDLVSAIIFPVLFIVYIKTFFLYQMLKD